MAGVIALLGHACASKVAAGRARSLLKGAVPWLLGQESETKDGFPFYAGPGVSHKRAFAGWCHGDPGIAMALLAAARGAGEPAWEQEALAIARRAARLSPKEAGVRDAGLCHGAAGLGHLFHRMSRATGDPILRQASEKWFARSLASRRDGGIAGFSAWGTGADGSMGWLASPGFQMGAAGIALSLLAACAEHEPGWDRLLLVSGPRVASEVEHP